MKLLNRYEAWWPVRIVLDETHSAPLSFMKQIGDSDKYEKSKLLECIQKLKENSSSKQEEPFLLSEINRNMTKSRIIIFEQILIGYSNIYTKQSSIQAIIKLDLWKNRDFAFFFASKFGFSDLALEWKQDQEIAIMVIQRDTSIFETVLSNTNYCKEVILAGLKIDGSLLECLPYWKRHDKNLILTALSAMPKKLYPKLFSRNLISYLLYTERDVMLEVAKYDPATLIFAEKTLREDREIVECAVRHHARAMEYLKGDLAMDRQLAKMAIEEHGGLALKYISHELKDREMVMTAVKSNGLALKFAKNYQTDREIVMTAVQQNGLAIEFAFKLQLDLEIVLAAVKQNTNAYIHLREELKVEPQVLEACGFTNIEFPINIL